MLLAEIKKRQYLLLWIVILGLSLALITVSAILIDSKPKVANVSEKFAAKQLLTTGLSRVNPQEVWVHEVAQRADLTQKRIDELEKAMEQLLKINSAASFEKQIEANDKSIANLQSDLKALDEHNFTTTKDKNLLPSSSFDIISSTNQLKKNELKKISLNLPQNREGKPLKTTDNTIPAGSFAAAVLLGGVDASTAIQASSDPRPILLRLIHPGTLPRRFKSDLQDCHVLAACYGDMSSERVFMRLEKLGCVERKTGEVIEMNIQGYVAGEDGRAGIRGAIVDKSGAAMRNAMLGGFFSSMGKFLGQARTPLLFSPNTGIAQNNSLSGSDILKQSTANGASGALDRYADFYINRAEQMQPVIQVAAGRKVDIVFTQGFDFSDSALRQVISKTHDQQRFSQIQTVDPQKSVQSWLSKKGNY